MKLKSWVMSKENCICIETCTSRTLRKKWKKKRNTVLNEIKGELRIINHDVELGDIKSQGSDTSKYFEVVRVIQRKEKKNGPKMLNDHGMIISNGKRKVRNRNFFFQNLFVKDVQLKPKEYSPTVMEDPITEDETSKVVRNREKTRWQDHKKYLSPKLSTKQKIKFFNKYLLGYRSSMIPRLPPKPPKIGVNVSVQLIICPSTLRKILSMCLINRCWDNLKKLIRLEQVVSQSRRFTIEQVFTERALAEKAITSSDYISFIFMPDITKAFDSINRSNKSYLEVGMTSSEMYMINILISHVALKVQYGLEEGKDIHATLEQWKWLSSSCSFYYLLRIFCQITT